LDINGKIIPLKIGHKGTQDFKNKWERKDEELNSPLRHFICSSMYQSYVSFNKIMLIKIIYMPMGTL
jgi:hypothetical protein